MSAETRETTARFDPQFITEDDIADLASFTGMSADECLERVRNYSMNEMARAWEIARPESPSEVMDFYRSNDLYLWELMQWHASISRTPYWNALHSFVESHPPSQDWRRVFDFGCGIGTDALFLAKSGYEVTAVDVKGPAFEFARHRLARRGLRANVIESTSGIPALDGSFDAAICFDVFEHLLDPLSSARALVQGLRSGGVLLQQATFSDYGVHPCHLEFGIRRFSGLRWHINLAGMGMKSQGPLRYAKCSGISHWMQKSRYDLWRATGLWLIKVD